MGQFTTLTPSLRGPFVTSNLFGVMLGAFQFD